MGKDIHLINIYLKIHNKKILTIDDLKYLAEYDPECFAKTCKNVVYNIPETKTIMEPAISETQTEETEQESFDWRSIGEILDNLKRLETNNLPIANVDAEKVKSLLGNLFMELLFPHNDKEMFMNMAGNERVSSFDKKA